MKGIILTVITSVGIMVRCNAATIDQNWESRFVLAPGLNGEVFAILSTGTNLYAGGAFTSAGAQGTAGLARWDGNSWNSVGGGLNGTVFTLATDGTNLYAGGSFDSAGGVAATNIAKWDGASWSSLGAVFLPNSLNPARAAIRSLLWDQNLFAAGMFTQAGLVIATNVARWDGQNWHPIGDGLGAYGLGNDVFQVFALAKHNNELYAGGLFPRSGGIGVTNLARWTGTAWEQVGGGVAGGSYGVYWFDGESGYVLTGATYALASSAAGLMVGGDFTEAGGLNATNLALWNGTNWSAIGGYTDGSVNHILNNGTNDWITGSFSTIGGIQASGIAEWNGAAWTNLGLGIAGSGIAMAKAGTNLYIGGEFQVAGSEVAGYLARWTGSDWTALTAGDCSAPSGMILGLAMGSDGQLYGAGDFVTAGKVRVNRVARYDGTNWHAFGNGFHELNIHSVAVLGTNVYVKGYFNRPASGITNLARWNGSDWAALGLGLGNDGYDPMINTLAAGTTNLFVSGNFKTAGGILVTNLARWDGGQWHSLNYTPTPYYSFTSLSSIDALATRDDDLFICERTTTYVGESSFTLRVRHWQGWDWTQVGTDISFATSPNISSSVWVGTNLYVVGQFIVTNNFFATNLLCWNGATWAGVSHPFGADLLVAPATTDGTNLFVAINSYGAPFTEVKLAKWNGNQWKVLGTGISSERPWAQVSSLAVRGRDLHVGGYFTSAGGKLADNLALWRDFPEITLGGRGWQQNGAFGLRVLGGKNQPVQLQTSTNLQSWLNLATQLPNSDAFDFTDSTASPTAVRYYRLLLLP